MMAQELDRLWIGIKGDASHLHKTLKDGIAGIQQFAAKAQQIGVGMTAAFTAPALALGSFSVKAFGDFEQQMNNIRAAANPTAEQLKQLKAAIESTAAATGMDPAAVAAGFGELVKAGTSVEAVLGGVGDAVVQFARVGELQMGEAATVIVNAMTQFGGTAEEMANVISQAADASTIGIADVAAAFSTGGGALKQFGQDAKDVSAAIAILGNAGIAGADAGTSLKSMFITALSGSGEATQVIKQFGLEFRDAAGQVKPMAALIEEVQSKLGGLDQATQDQALFSLFGSYGFRAASALLKTGAKGFDEFKASMASALPVTEKFKIMTEGFWGEFDKLKASLLLAAASIGEVLAPVLKSVGGWVKDAADWFSSLSPMVKTAAVVFAALAAAVGPVLLAFGLAGGAIAGIIGAITGVVGVISTVVGVVASTYGLILLPLVPLAAGVVAAIAAVGVAVGGFVANAGGLRQAWVRLQDWGVKAWEAIKQKWQELKTWLEPILEAAASFAVKAWDRIVEGARVGWDAVVQLAEKAKEAVVEVWKRMTGDASVDWGRVQEAIRDVFIAGEFALGHFEQVWDTAWKGMQYYAVAALNAVVKNLWLVLASPVLVPAYAAMQTNWQQLWSNMADVTLNAVRTMSINVRTFVDKLKDALAMKTVDWASGWAQFTAGAEVTFTGLNVPALDELEAQLKEAFEQSKGTLKQSFADFREAWLKEHAKGGLVQESLAGADKVQDAAKAGERIGKTYAGAIKREASAVDAVLFKSAEGMFRRSQYFAMLQKGLPMKQAEVAKMMQQPGAAPQPAPVMQPQPKDPVVQDQAKDIKKIKEALFQMLNQGKGLSDDVEILPMDL